MAKNTAKTSYGQGFGPEDDLFGELGRTNNPNATPVGMRSQGLDPNLRRIVEQNMGTRRRTAGGQLEDPLAPTGIDWLKDNGGRGQVNSWDQPSYPAVNQSGADRRALADLLDGGQRQTVYDGRGVSMRTPYGTGTNVPLPKDIPGMGTQRLPNAEAAMLAQNLSSIFNEQASTSHAPIGGGIPSNFDLTVPQAIPPSGELQRAPSFNPNDSLWQRFERGEFNQQPSAPLAPNPLGDMPTASPMPLAANIPTSQRQSSFDPKTQAAIDYFTNPQPQPGLWDMLSKLYMMFTPK